MKETLHKAFAITMAFLLLASTVSWTVGKHYCMGRLMNVSLFEHAEDCGMAMGVIDESAMQVQLNDLCCSDELIFVDGQDDLKISFNDLNLEQQSFLLAFTHSYLTILESSQERKVHFKDYSPPPLIRDIHILDQTFLI